MALCRYIAAHRADTVTAKTDLPPVPPALADVALIDGPTCAAAGGEAISTFHDGVRRTEKGELAEGEVPYPLPVIRRVRFSRWRLADVRAWLIARAAQATADDEVIRRATKASAKAKALRTTAQAGA
jgi:hypothetical protein